MSLEVSGSASAESSSSSSSSSPVSTADVAAEVISSFESGNDEGATSNEAPAAPAAAQADQAAQVDPDDFDASPAETTDALGRKRPNRIPHDRVGKMIAKREEKLLSAVAKELGLTPAEGAALKIEDVVGHITQSRSKYQDYETRFQNYQTVEQIMEADSDRFVRMLAKANPDMYGKFVDFLDGKSAAPAAAAAAAPQGDNDPEPEPDFDLGDGRKTYSLDGMRKRDEWRDRQTEKRLAQQFEDRFKPFEEERKQREQQAQERQRFEEIHTQALAKIEKDLEKARTWVGFNENEQAIQDHVIKNKVSLFDAYMAVVLPKFQTDRNKIRAEVIDEINKQPKSTSVATNPASAKAVQGEKSISSRDIAAEEIAKAMGR